MSTCAFHCSSQLLTDVNGRAKDAGRADAGKLPAGHERRAAARAHGAAGVPLCEDAPAARKAINVGRVGRRVAGKAEVAVAHCGEGEEGVRNRRAEASLRGSALRDARCACKRGQGGGARVCHGARAHCERNKKESGETKQGRGG